MDKESSPKQEDPEANEQEDPGESLADVQKRRKQIEQDAQLLANRIALLEAEEAKTQKKIIETRTKASEIMDKKKKNEIRLQDKMDRNMQEMDNQEHISKNFYDQKKQRELAKKNREEDIHQGKAQDAKRIREEGRLNDQIKTGYKGEMQHTNKQKAGFVKFREQVGRELVEQSKANRSKGFKKDYEDRVMEEEMRKTAKEQELLKMEALESELIKRLQNTQNVQNEAFQELEEALRESPKQLRAKEKQEEKSKGTKTKGKKKGSPSKRQDEEDEENM